MTISATPELANPPGWFSKAMAAPVQARTVTVDGAEIAYRAWGDDSPGEAAAANGTTTGNGATTANGIVLVHGGAAHSRWWDHIAPMLAVGRRVAALDLSGHGDSDRRDGYSLDGWAREALAVAADAGLAGPPIIVGHSMGGFVALRAARLFGAELAGIVVIDSPVHDLTPEEQAARDAQAFGPLRVYPTRQAAIDRFHPMPDQPTLPYVLEHVASTSIREVDGG